MITTNDMVDYLKAEPFQPFRLHMASGKTFDVRHPEMVRVGKHSLILFTLVSDSPAVHDRWETVSLTLIEHISQLEIPTNQN